MPNHCSNTLTAENIGNWDIFTTTREAGRTYKELDFNKFAPMPARIRRLAGLYTNRIRPGMSNVKVQAFIDESFKNSQDFFKNGYAIYAREKNPVKTAKADARAWAKDPQLSDAWYPWSIANWGTKWNAYDTDIHAEDCLTFTTAWSPPEEAILALSKKYPDTEITLEFSEPGYDFAGTYVYLGGELISKEDTAYFGVIEPHFCDNDGCSCENHDDCKECSVCNCAE